jgi:hypothetical protein
VVRIPAGTRKLSLLLVQTGISAHPASSSMGTVKGREGDVDHSPPSIAEVKNE